MHFFTSYSFTIQELIIYKSLLAMSIPGKQSCYPIQTVEWLIKALLPHWNGIEERN